MKLLLKGLHGIFDGLQMLGLIGGGQGRIAYIQPITSSTEASLRADMTLA